MTYIPWILSVWVVAQMWLAGNQDIRCWYVGIAGQVLWLYFDYQVEAWGLMPLAIFLTFIYVRNIIKWNKLKKLKL